MKIKTKIALRYSSITAILMTIFAITIYVVSAKDREKEFYDDLYKEGITKANLLLECEITPEVMHAIYKNNIEYIDEVEVAIYVRDFELIYHDAKDIDIVKENPQLIEQIAEAKQNLHFYVGKYQVAGFVFQHNNTPYVVTAAAYDGYGYNKLKHLAINLIILTIVSIFISFILGYYLAKQALKPISEISNKMKVITAKNLHTRLDILNPNDEFGELQHAFNDTLDILEASFEAQKMFVSNVSHELRTPLATLIGEIDYALLKQRSINQYIETLKSSKLDASRLIRLINGLLDLAKASYDESKISTTQVRIDEILLDARDEVLKSNSNYKVQLQFNDITGDESQMRIMGNEYLLKIAFLNLMENSCKFSYNRTCLVNIYSMDKSVNIIFSDNGIGIPSDDLSNVFEAFYRGQNKDYTEGNGIGLALVQKVVKIHKGSIDLKSTVGIGTTIKIVLQQ